jgi:hypothetical protein
MRKSSIVYLPRSTVQVRPLTPAKPLLRTYASFRCYSLSQRQDKAKSLIVLDHGALKRIDQDYFDSAHPSLDTPLPFACVCLGLGAQHPGGRYNLQRKTQLRKFQPAHPQRCVRTSFSPRTTPTAEIALFGDSHGGGCSPGPLPKTALGP